MRLLIEVSFYKIKNLSGGLRLRNRRKIKDNGPEIKQEFLAYFGLGGLSGSWSEPMWSKYRRVEWLWKSMCWAGLLRKWSKRSLQRQELSRWVHSNVRMYQRIRTSCNRYMHTERWLFELFKDRQVVQASRHGLKPGIFLKMWLNQFFCFLHVPSTTQGEKTHWFRFLKLYFLKVLFEHLKNPFYIWDIFEGTSKSYPILIRTSM